MDQNTQPHPELTEILRTLRLHLPDLGKRYGVRTVGVFGS